MFAVGICQFLGNFSHIFQEFVNICVPKNFEHGAAVDCMGIQSGKWS